MTSRPAIQVIAAMCLLVGCLGSAGAETRDRDADGMPNRWEARHRLDPDNASDAARDPDRDRLTNLEEYQHHGDPHRGDTDSDTLRDGTEVYRWHSKVEVPNELIGRVQVTGRCPSSTEDQPCEPDDLFAIPIVVRTTSGSVVARTASGLNGRFAFDHVAPGRYEVEASAVAGTAAPAPLDAAVPGDRAAPVVASFDFADTNGRGVVGQATQSPTCPGPGRLGEDCVAPFSGATIDVHRGDEGGPVIASATTADDGYYAFRLDPGAYTLVAEQKAGSQFPTPPAPVSFTVSASDNGPHVVNAPYDTGIR